MKILIISDLHDRKIELVVPEEVLKSVDFIISAGDYDYLYPPKTIGIYGNHESEEELEKGTLIGCHMKIITIHGLKFAGIGGVFCGEKRYKNPSRKRWYHQLQEIIDQYLDKAPTVDFFITHERAYGIFDSIHGKQVGNVGFRKYIDEKKPKFYISGHISNSEKTKIVGNTLCINPHGKDWDFVIMELEDKQAVFRFMKGDEEIETRREDIGCHTRNQ